MSTKPGKIPNKVTQAVQAELVPSAATTTTTTVTTKEQEVRKTAAKAALALEKAPAAEKDHAPQIIIQYTDATGLRKTKTFGCSSIRLSEYKDQTLPKAGGPKTTINISIEATVLEVS